MYRCSNCWAESLRFTWKCVQCNEWWTMQEVKEEKISKSNSLKPSLTEEKVNKEIQWYKLNDILKDWVLEKSAKRILSNNETFNTFFWGWLVSGSINLIAGDPWVWKSTFLTYIAKYFPNKNIVYISWEENEIQVLGRANRMKKNEKDFENLKVYNEKLLENIDIIIQKENPDIIIIDSLNLLETNSIDWELWGLKQQKHITRKLVKNIKKLNIAAFLVWHLTSDWEISGAHFIQHMVDSVIKIEPATERWDSLKIMKNLKNRFSWSDLIVYELYQDSIEIVDQKRLLDLFIQETAVWEKWTALSAVTLSWGHQVFLIEIQALITPMEFNFSEKIIKNFNKDQFKTLIKIIGQNIDSSVYESDIAINIFSPLKYNGDEISLAIIMSIVWYIRDYNLWKKVFLWLVWFNWELKSIPRQRDIINKLKSFWIKDEDIISTDKFKNIKEIIRLIAKENGKKTIKK